MDRKRSGGRGSSHKRTLADSEGLFDWNLGSDRIHFSPRWLALIGCDDHEVGTRPEDWLARVHPDDEPELSREIEAARAGHSTGFACRYRLRHKDGSYRWMACRAAVSRDRAGHPARLTGSQADVTVEMATDRLTGLPNRLLLIERISHAIARARRSKTFEFAVLLIDVGRPASFGPASASAPTDALLTAVARRLETCLRNPGVMPSLGHHDLVARLDGDHFAVLLTGLRDIAHAKVAADRILAEILEPIRVTGREVRLSASIGVAVSATGYTTADQMLHDAEVAQHRARMLGGSHCEIFDTAILKSEEAELQLENDFAAALQRREFVLMFQPIVSLASNEIEGFEALVRWRHPVLGMIPPGDFIPLAERTAFIVPLGNWILREACVKLREWDADLASAREVSMSVNISSVQVEDPGLVDHVAEALRDSGLEPRRLVLELTEGIAMANPTAISTLLMRLRTLGVRISVDDFGTGYSSLAYLRQFPIDALKIDRSFVREMVTNKDTAEIVAGVMTMARQLGLHVVAEGIEQDEQCGRLRALKCDAGQGTLFAAPLPAETAAELIKSGLPPRLDAGAPTAAPAHARKSHLLAPARVLLASRRVGLAMAALALLLSAGFVVVAAKAARHASSVPGDHPQPGMTVPGSAAASLTPVRSSAVAPVTAVTRSSAKDAPPKDAALPKDATLPKDAMPAKDAPPRDTTTAKPIVRTPVTSLEVVHLHRLGSCRGRLDVTRDGIRFVSETDGDADAFALNYTEFLDAVSEDTLILRSATRTYRFKAAGTREANPTQLRDLADAIARSRR